MNGGLARHILCAVATSTPPPKHMRAIDAEGRHNMSNKEIAAIEKAELSIEKLLEACKKREADPYDVIALALTEGMREQAETSGMTMKAQSDLAMKIVDKGTPSRKALDVSGSLEVEVKKVEMYVIDPQNPSS